MLDKLFVISQYVTPQRTLSQLAGKLADSKLSPAMKDRVVRWFIQRYGVDMSEALEADPSHYPSFNAFFTRALKPGLRPLAGDESVVISPVDGAISQLGQIRNDRIVQAKGQSFSLFELLGGDAVRAKPFEGGQFATIYLAPKDYHRIHMPVAGTLREMVHVPGRLFSVNPTTAAQVPNLFARNERVAALFDTEFGPMALVLVGAMIVGSVETTWAGVVAPGAKTVTSSRYEHMTHPITFERGEEMGRFRLGSTVVMVFPKNSVGWEASLKETDVVRMGQAFGQQQTN